MASVYRRPGSPFWMASFKTPEGAWAAKSTKTKSRPEALKMAHLWETGGTQLLLENPQGSQFERVLRGLYEQMTGKRQDPNPAGAWLRSWAATSKTQKAAKTGERYGKVVEDFVLFLGEGATLDLRTIPQSKVQEFLDSESAAGKSGTTVALNGKILRAAFNHALRSGLVERNPAAVLTLPAIVHQKREVFTPGEVRALLEASRGIDWATAILLGRFLGMRLGDASNLMWENLDLPKGVIEYTPQKTSRKGKTLRVPMSKELRKHFDRLASEERAQKSPFVCPSLAGREVGGRHGLSAEFMALMERAGVDCKRKEGSGGVGRAFSSKSFHSLRHTIASDLANSNAPEKVARDLLGHATAAMSDRYTHLEISTMRRAVNKIGQRDAKRSS